MAYHVVTDPQVRSQIRALPPDMLPQLAEVMAVVEMVPWNGPPYNEDNPDSPMRQLTFGDGRGFVTYLVLEHLERVDVLDVTWIG